MADDKEPARQAALRRMEKDGLGPLAYVDDGAVISDLLIALKGTNHG